MTFNASIVRVLLINTLVNCVLLAPVFLAVLNVDVNVNDVLFVYAILVVGTTIFQSIFASNKITVSIDKDSIGGVSLNSMFEKRLQFVSFESVDKLASTQRSLIDKLSGSYKISNKEGKGFKLNKYYYPKEQFNEIKNQIVEILKIKLEE